MRMGIIIVSRILHGLSLEADRPIPNGGMMERNRAMGSHQSTRMGKDEWLTPPEIINAIGPFDLDPCSPINRPWPTATEHYTIMDNGLMLPWHGRVWLNPPYGQETGLWLSYLATHRNGIALIMARTETEMFFEQVWERADGILFLKGRLYFYHVNGQKADGNAGAPSCLIAYGQNNVEALGKSGLSGKLVRLTTGSS